MHKKYMHFIYTPPPHTFGETVPTEVVDVFDKAADS